MKVNRDALLPRAANAVVPVRLGTASIGLLKLYPGISGRVLAAAVDAHPDGLVLELYGSGTGPTVDGSLVRELKLAASRKAPLIGVSQCPHGTVAAPSYVSSQVYRDLGMISGHDLTPEAALTELHYIRALAVPDQQIAHRIAQPVAGELTPPAAGWA